MKRLIKKSERQGNKWYAYHGMDKKYLEDNLKNGIEPTGDHGDFVYLASDEDVCWSYCGPNGVVLKILMNEENLEEIKVNNGAFPYTEFAHDYFFKNIKSREGYDIESSSNIFGIIDMIAKYESEQKAAEISDEIFEAYFEEAELMVSYIEANQIVDVIQLNS